RLRHRRDHPEQYTIPGSQARLFRSRAGRGPWRRPGSSPGQGSFRPAVTTYHARHGEEQLLVTLSALKSPTAEGAIEAFPQVEDLQKQSLIKLHDAAVVYWPAGRESPKPKQLVARGPSARS